MTKQNIHIGGVLGTILIVIFVGLSHNNREPIVAEQPYEPATWSSVSLEEKLASVSDLLCNPGEERMESEIKWLALNMYHEARGEGRKGKLAVAHVTRNRCLSDRYPNSFEDVVRQHNGKGKYQFSWVHEGFSTDPTRLNQEEWQKSVVLARSFLSGETYRDTTNGSLHYHAEYTLPFWAKGKLAAVKIGRHLFYNDIL